MSENNQLDMALLSGYLDNLGAEIVQQMLDLYQQQSVVYLNDINQAMEVQSQPDWQESCHKMKGAAGSAGLIGVHQKLVAIEKSTDSWPIKKQYFQELSTLNQAAISCFTQWLSNEQ
ncbi:hypothetical protein tinsulaeT_12920 [Thalassotalea insulae]|uniref:HPt domain-containing protein n=1 Tax=Thalassotalea insulae TaxID=2056778 RepID=A0ABQ6GPU8_9GAMM|nr:Hpt domain-containing protein [Thalassotalea insulae]GLX77952.1 hypothetical protein tinsulaeT_12920 [Thalassotalea insulae]